MDNKRPSASFAFRKTNYLLLFVGIAVIIIGFALMSGGGSDDPTVFKGDYVLDAKSFELMESGMFEVSEDVRQQLSGLKDKVFTEEPALLEAVASTLGAQVYGANKFKIRSATTIHADIFSARRISVAPVVVLFGYGFIFFAIMYKGRRESENEEPFDTSTSSARRKLRDRNRDQENGSFVKS